jgi:hypothetical protein
MKKNITMTKNHEYQKVAEKILGLPYSKFSQKLSEVGLRIGEKHASEQPDDKGALLSASIFSERKDEVPVLIRKDHSVNIHVNDAKDLEDLTSKLWHLCTDTIIFIRKTGNIFSEVIEFKPGEGKEESKFERRKITEEELAQIPEFLK